MFLSAYVNQWSRATEPLIAGSQVWERANASLAITAVPEEPSVIYESGTWKMWYSGGWTNSAMGYATCTGDPTVTGNWTKYAGNPVLGQGGSGYGGNISGVNVIHDGSTYYCYAYQVGITSNLVVSTSSDGISWGTPATAIAAAQVAWIRGWANTFVWREAGAWKMLIEGFGSPGNGGWQINYATSADGLSWTVQGTGPLSGLQVPNQNNYGGPWLASGGAKVGGLYRLWYHAGSGSFTDIYYATSPDLVTWTRYSKLGLSCNQTQYEAQQVADPCVVEQGGKCYLFFDGINNDTGPSGFINVATWPDTLARLVS